MKQVTSAFVKAQAKFGKAIKNAKNPHFRSSYADLASCLDAVMDALTEQNLALVQRVFDAEHGVCVETIVMHESGEELSFGKLFVPASKQDAQGYGSALTYCRRYSVMLLGIAGEDDDGNAASKSAPEIKKRPARPKEELIALMSGVDSSEGLRGLYKSLTTEERELIRAEAAAFARTLEEAKQNA